jgi:subtilisin-like proprotein convertase family protein
MKLARTTRIAIACLAASVLSAAGAPTAHAADFFNTQPITISDLQRTQPYPSTIAVSGLGVRTSKVTLTIDLDHRSKSDLEMLLVGPRGQKVLVMSDAAGSTASPVTWTFDDAAAAGLTCGDTAPESPSGAYRPTNCERFEGDSDALDAPAPQPPYAGALAAFNGTDPNGAWKLYVADVASDDDGILTSWKLSIEASGSANPPASADPPPTADPPRLVVCPAGTSGGVTCRRDGRVMRITGTPRIDTIVGTSGRDIIRCGAGKDSVAARAGNDVIRCGPGDDRITAGRGDDVVDGGSGDDKLEGGPGNDRLAGGRGDDRLAGGRGRDRLSGGPGSDRLAGGSGNDVLLGGSGKDALFGGRGNDRLVGGPGRDRLSGGPGRNKVTQ